MDLTAIQAAFSSLKVATTVAKSILETKTMVEVQGKVIEIQSALLEAQSAAISATTAQSELVERVRQLEAQLAAANAWSGETHRYALVSPFRNGGTVFALKQAESNGDSPHLLCPNCYGSRRKSFLAPVKDKDDWISLSCSACKFLMGTSFRGIGDAKYAEAYAKQA